MEMTMNETSNRANVLESPAASRPQVSAPPSRQEAIRKSEGAGFVARLGQVIPMLVVLLALGGIAYAGHLTDWKVPTIPKFSALIGNGTAEKDDWCEAHSVAESQCVECNASLLPKPPAYGWCRKHGVHDCPLDHPDVAQLKDRSSVAPADLERAQRALDFADRPANNSKCKVHPRRIQFASEDALKKSGIEMAPAWDRRMEECLAANGEITYDPTRVASLATPVPGRIWRVEEKGKIGQSVSKGDVLALIDALEVGKAKAELLQALAQVDLRQKTVERLKPLAGTGVSGAQYQEAEADLRAAQIRVVSAEQALVNLGLPIRADDVKGLGPTELGQRVQFLGLPESVIRTLDSRATTNNLIPVRAPFDGVVVARQAVLGEMVDATKALFTVADTRQMWLTLNVPLDALKPFREKNPQRLLSGKPVRFALGGGSDEVTGTVVWVSTAADERTRALQLRADLPNLDGRLRANTFGAGRIVLRVEEQAVTVPTEAIHWDTNCNVVFVWDKYASKEGAPKVFHVRSVRPGVKDAENTEIIAGLLPGEMVATKNSGALRAELLKSSMGEG